jgi:hypothetical protein
VVNSPELISFSHKYTYYALTAFFIHVPLAVKRTLTTMQIIQFVVGASYALIHPFISYTAPGVMAITPGQVEDTEPSPSSTDNAAVSFGTVYVTQPCITTSATTFAVWLNIFYLLPLTGLFVNFFISSYLRQTSRGAGVTAVVGS